MAEKGFKRKLAAIPTADAKRYNRLVNNSGEPMFRNLMTYRASLVDPTKQYRVSGLCRAAGCDELQRWEQPLE